MESKTEEAIRMLSEIDRIQDGINDLKKNQDSLRMLISNCKKKIEEENKHLLGKNALCFYDKEGTIKSSELVCNKVMCNSEFIAIPLFKNAFGNKIRVDSYVWKEDL